MTNTAHSSETPRPSSVRLAALVRAEEDALDIAMIKRDIEALVLPMFDNEMRTQRQRLQAVARAVAPHLSLAYGLSHDRELINGRD